MFDLAEEAFDEVALAVKSKIGLARLLRLAFDGMTGAMRRKLYVKAKAEPAFRVYVLYDKIHRADILLHAYRLARANAGASGVDGMTFEKIEALGLEAWLASLREELVAKTYRPDPVRRVMIPKASGDGERPLGIATIRDRVVQTAAKIVLSSPTPMISSSSVAAVPQRR